MLVFSRAEIKIQLSFSFAIQVCISKVKVMLIPTNEELAIARETLALV